jgi:hypothetical protein
MLRILTSAAEALGLLIVLVLALSYSVPLVIWVSLALMLIAAFVLITGRTAPRIRSRGKALVVGSIAGVCLMASATIYQDQRDENLALLRETDPDAYLAELQRVDDARWIEELEQLRPEQHAEEMARRAQVAEAERQQACTDRRSAEAYVMIQEYVRRELRAPATADFPARYGQGTGHITAFHHAGMSTAVTTVCRRRSLYQARAWLRICTGFGGNSSWVAAMKL